MIGIASPRGLVVPFLAVWLIGCASHQPSEPIESFQVGGAVGVLVLTPERPMHQHLGATMLGDFEKEIDADWELETWAEWKLQQLLGRQGRAIRLRLGDAGGAEQSLISSGWRGTRVNERLAPLVQELIDLQNLSALITVEPEWREVEADTDAQSSGYGLYTRCVGGFFCKAFVLDHITLRLFNAQPLTYLRSEGAADEKFEIEMAESKPTDNAVNEQESQESEADEAAIVETTSSDEGVENEEVATELFSVATGKISLNFGNEKTAIDQIDLRQVQDALYQILGERMEQLLFTHVTKN